MITHLLRCHLFMEPIAIACWRQLPSIHPLWKLLQPHVRGVLAINTLGRERLIPAGGVADNTLSLGGGGTKELAIDSWLTGIRRVMNALERFATYEGIHSCDSSFSRT